MNSIVINQNCTAHVQYFYRMGWKLLVSHLYDFYLNIWTQSNKVKYWAAYLGRNGTITTEF